MKFLLGSIFLIITFFSTIEKEDLKDPYPIWGKVYLDQQMDSLASNQIQDTIFLENVNVFAMVDSVIIASTRTNRNGKYWLEFSVKYYEDEENSVYIVAQHPNYAKVSTETILYGHHFSGNGMICDFGLGKKK